MADTKLSALAALTTTAKDDLFLVDDVSDASMAASGTDKKVTRDNLANGILAAGTLASRPAAGTAGIGFYFATDDNGGTLYRSDGSAWTRIMARGTELGYAEITTDFTTTSTTGADVTGLTITVTVLERPIKVIIDGRALSNSGAAGAVIIIYEGATALALFDDLSAFRVGFHREVRLAPSAGSHTYKAVLLTGGSGTATLTAGGTGSQAFIQAVEI